MPTYTLPDDWAAVTALANATAVKEANPITVLQLLSTTPRTIPHAFRGDLPLGSAGRPAA